MPYTAEISRSNPSCFLFLIDQSGSMKDPLDPPGQPGAGPVSGEAPAPGRTKAQGVADSVNRLLQNLIIKCAKSEGVRNYYQVGVIGYGGDASASKVGPAFGGSLAGRELIEVGELADNPARIEERTKKVDDGAGGLLAQRIKFPIWFDPTAGGGTPMKLAFGHARITLARWIAEHRSSFPPIVINITDGAWTGDDPSSAADALKGLATDDGEVLLFNIHITAHSAAAVEFPDDDAPLPDQYARFLFGISSLLPEYMQNVARQEGLRVSARSRGFAFNADMVSLIRFLDIGTRPSNLR